MVNMANSVKAMCAVAIVLAIRQKRKKKGQENISFGTLTLAAVLS